jgi:serine protease Do
MKFVLSLFILCVVSFPLPGRGARNVRVSLSQGAEVRGELVSDKPERIVLDLGFSLLAIPRGAIAELKEEQSEKAKDDATVFTADLFREGKGGETFSVRELAEKIGEAVVLVRTPSGLGSGFIINPEGYVITNDHVIAGETNISVTVFTGASKSMRKHQYGKVRIVACSPFLDLALLKIEDVPSGEKFVTVPLGASEQLRQGAPVFAVGSPLGLERTVTSGIVSLRNRLWDGTRLLVQTTAQINPGNSGGPLFNMHGEVVGVNDLKIIGGAEGLGFAIPVDVVKEFLRNRDAYAFDPRNPNAGFRYFSPPLNTEKKTGEEETKR